jgi:hypothetical protein
MDLLSRAEAAFGSRDAAKKIFQPVFNDTGPYLINTPTFDGAFAALSRNAAGYWPTVIYEMAHETIHLLDPIPGYATWIEEGAAVAFSVLLSRTLTDHPMTPPQNSAYQEALSLVERLPLPTLTSLRAVRHLAGRFSSVTDAHLTSLFPTLELAIIEKLVEECMPR